MNLPEAIQAASIALQALDDRIAAMERRQAEIEATLAKLAPIAPESILPPPAPAPRYFTDGFCVWRFQPSFSVFRATDETKWGNSICDNITDFQNPELREIPASEGEP